jgi:hypothetical protein
MIPPAIKHLFVFLFAIVIIYVQGPDYIYHLWDHVPEQGDSFINVWILAWDAHAIASPGASIWDAPMFYPVKNSLAFSESMFGNLWITLPVQYLTGNPVFSANVLIMASFVLGMYCVFLLVEELTGSYWAGIVAGIVFSFTPYRWTRIFHFQLLPFFWSPVALLYANRFFKATATRDFIWMMLAFWVQFYASVYLGMMLLVLMVAQFVAHVALERGKMERWQFISDRRLCRLYLAGAGCSVVALFPTLWPYIEVSRDWGFVRSLSGNAENATEPLALLAPSFIFENYFWLREKTFRIRTFLDGLVFFGFTPWLLALTGLCLVRFRKIVDADALTIKRYAWCALVMGVLMFGPYLYFMNKNTGVPLPYMIFYYLFPGAKALRVPARFAIPLLLCLSVVSGYAVAWLLDRLKSFSFYKKTAIALAVTGCFYMDYGVNQNWVGNPVAVADRIPSVYTYLAKSNKGKPIVELPMGNWDAFQYLYYQTAHWQPALGGTSGWSLAHLNQFANESATCPSPECFNHLRYSPALTVVVHLDRYPPALKSLWENADLSSYGFEFSGRKGNALVWERERSPVVLSQQVKLAPGFPVHLIEHGGNTFVSLPLMPREEGRPWSGFAKLPDRIELSALGKDGQVIDHRQSALAYPPLLIVPGETENLELAFSGHMPQGTEKIKLAGPFLAGVTLERSQIRWLNTGGAGRG